MLELTNDSEEKAIDLYGEIVKVEAPPVGAIRALNGHQKKKDPFEQIELMASFLKQCGLNDEQINKIKPGHFEKVVKYICEEATGK